MSDKKDKEQKEKSLERKKQNYMTEMEDQGKEKDTDKEKLLTLDADQDQEDQPTASRVEEAHQSEESKVWQGIDAGSKETPIEEPPTETHQEIDREPLSHDNVVGIRDKQDKLTPKQEAFVRQVLAGDDLSTAYRKSYEASKMSSASINREAHRLSNNPKITPRLRRGMEVREVSVQSSYHSLRHSVIERLNRMADDLDASDSARVRSLEMLGKHVGLFTDQVSISTDRSTEELQEELTTKIAELLELDEESG